VTAGRPLVLLVALVLAAGLAGSARGDGDPASDYLLGQQVFFPYDVKIPAQAQADFAALVRAVNKAGFKIRVAIIADSYDLGSVPSLFRLPRTYARFLGGEIAFLYKQRLLVVMPNGFGFNWPGHPVARQYTLLGRIPIAKGPAALVVAAQTAVQRLAAADGVKVAAPTNAKAAGSQTSHDRIVIIVAAFAAVLVAFAVRLLLLRRRRRQAA
jgi:hypothetical protein